MPTLHRDAADALAGVLADGITIAVGGFGLSGNPNDLIEAVRDSDVRELTIVSNNMGVDGKGLGLLLENSQVRKVVASYMGSPDLPSQAFVMTEQELSQIKAPTLVYWGEKNMVPPPMGSAAVRSDFQMATSKRNGIEA